MYKLRNWVNKDELSWAGLSKNPKGYDILSNNLDKIHIGMLSIISENFWIIKKNIEKYINRLDWFYLSLNYNAIDLLKQNPKKIEWHNICSIETGNINDLIDLFNWYPEKIDWGSLSANSNDLFIDFFKQNPEKINWNSLSSNSNNFAVNLLKQNPEKINWEYLSYNQNPDAIELLKQNPEKIDRFNLSKNPSDAAVELLKQYPEKIDWYELSYNTNNKAIELLKQNPEKIDWVGLSLNHGLEQHIDFLKQNINKFNMYYLSYNPVIFELDYDAIKQRTSIFKEELISKALHPNRIKYWLENDPDFEI